MSQWRTLERIRSSMGLSDEEFAEIIGAQISAYRKKRTQDKSPPLSWAIALGEAANVSVERVLDGKIDYIALEKQFLGHGHLPERYQPAAYSRRRTSINVLHWCALTQGYERMRGLMREHQIPTSLFDHPNESINIQLVTDLLDSVHAQNSDFNLIHDIGQSSLYSPANQIFFSQILPDFAPRKIYSYFIEELVGLFDKNFFYRIEELTDTHCVIAAPQNPDICDGLKQSTLGSRAVCAYKAGVISTFSRFGHLPFAQVTEISCAHRGDAYCRYFVDYSGAYFQFRSKQKQRASARPSLQLL